MRLPESFRFVLVLLLTLVLLGAELTGLCHGRRIPSAEAHDVESPYLLSNGYKQHGSRRRRLVEDLSESKRKVPTGSNPLHNR
ncbi:hypothetical protein BAE44_0019098 [Dichanthelium oligosanthes]|uniref:Uncharacterized protein n=1 Tax=Dichanthelium oligosanthes TaxID=888268 RepID=A0A1E5V3Z5_9POAL|nr:hypothetical protein BAE44_0019098 [Dichanthelium oligosanthes]